MCKSYKYDIANKFDISEGVLAFSISENKLLVVRNRITSITWSRDGIRYGFDNDSNRYAEYQIAATLHELKEQVKLHASRIAASLCQQADDITEDSVTQGEYHE